ncbi:hypothetical protein SDC9_168511 [bioreactor metagenome]|uniref:Uncharacterized protein n=1 Tax=bioreactor metagenome TaxID=1076179 RepID=A0A645G5A0_9ZZZZ
MACTGNFLCFTMLNALSTSSGKSEASIFSNAFSRTRSTSLDLFLTICLNNMSQTASRESERSGVVFSDLKIMPFEVIVTSTVSRSRSFVTTTTALASSPKKRSNFLSFFSTLSRKESLTVVLRAVIEMFIKVPLSCAFDKKSIR